MLKWEVTMQPSGSVGTHVVRASMRSEAGDVVLSGEESAILELISNVDESYEASKPTPKMVRFVLVDSEGSYVAMAFEVIYGNDIGLDQIEEVENFASNKLGKSLLAVNWSYVAPPANNREEEVGGEDIVGGIRCEVPPAPVAIQHEDVISNVVDGPWAAPV